MSWFRKWSFDDDVPMDDVYKRLYELEARVERLEEENVELTNELYRMENSLDSRIDILASEPYDLSKFTLDK
jgi:predicted RNase H-like nuclease (RuvC/YqgF family)